MQQHTHTTAIIVAAGSSRRMGFDKLLHPLRGVPVLAHTLRALESHPLIHSVVVVAGENIDAVRALLQKYPPAKPVTLVRGGATRAHSVKAGVAACPNAAYVAIHDGARPFVPAMVVSRAVQAALQVGAAAPALPVKDTIKVQYADGRVESTPARDTLRAVQTPQVFKRSLFVEALAQIPEAEYALLTDDCMVMERAGLPVQLVQGAEENIKITTPADLRGTEGGAGVRIGHGYDVHRLVEGRKLLLGGVEVPYEKGLLGHSDADVLLHVVADALLGAAALGDIGRHFPDNDPAYAGADSLALLQKIVQIVREAGYEAVNIDATILCQAPKLAPHIPAMRQNIAAALGVGEEGVSVKATTEEGLGFTGEGAGIAAHCVVLLQSL